MTVRNLHSRESLESASVDGQGSKVVAPRSWRHAVLSVSPDHSTEADQRSRMIFKVIVNASTWECAGTLEFCRTWVRVWIVEQVQTCA
mmetsp:Transcript_63441/g.147826  ORF Transcript_63441/g.147826 Transcript_63441/m.147826 type:complete len:88 (-) Transcript_63441:138-401(-)